MKTLLLAFLLICCNIPVTAQNISSAEYYFDVDPGHGKGISLDIGKSDSIVFIQSEIQVPDLASGIHTLFIRTCTEQGVWSLSESQLIFIARVTQFASAEITEAEYFFDIDKGQGKGTVINGDFAGSDPLSLSIPIDNLTEGFHQLYIRVRNHEGLWSAVEQMQFYVIRNIPGNIISAEYFFDTDPGQGKALPLSLTSGDSVQIVSEITIPFTEPGIHYLYLRTRNETGEWSIVESRQLFISPPLNIGQISAAEYFFDIDPGHGNGESFSVITGDQIQLVTEVYLENLAAGFHNMYIRTQNESGIWSLADRQLFYVSAALTEMVRAEYYFDDNDPGIGSATPLQLTVSDRESNYFISLPDQLLPGEHTITLRIQQGEAGWDFSETRTFLVEELHALPVELLYFKGWLQNDNVVLKWEISAEKAAAEFVIQRSEDGKTFVPIATISGRDSVSALLHSYTDKSLTGGQYYYRLIHIDINGEEGFSGLLYFQLAKKSILKLYPNPVTHTLNIVLPQPGRPAVISVITQQGQVIIKSASHDKNIESINVSRLAAGNYQLIVEQDGKRYVQGFFKNGGRY